MFIQTEATPNPATLKFLPGRAVMPDGTLDLRDATDAERSPLAQRLFGVVLAPVIFKGAVAIVVMLEDHAEAEAFAQYDVRFFGLQILARQAGRQLAIIAEHRLHAAPLQRARLRCVDARGGVDDGGKGTERLPRGERRRRGGGGGFRTWRGRRRGGGARRCAVCCPWSWS